MSKNIVYLIGAGRMGLAHARALLELGYSLDGVCDPNLDACNRIGDEFGVAVSCRFSDATKMFETLGAADLVIVATTADTHCELVCLAARASVKAILCEKPMAVSVEQCNKMIEVCGESGARLAINHQMRFMPQYVLVKDIFDQDKLGRLASINVVAGCFGLAMNGSHYIEAFNYLTGTWPSRVSANFTGDPFQNPRGPNYFDQGGDFHFVSDSSQRLHLSVGHDQGHGMTTIYAGRYGHVFVDELQGEMIVTSRLPEHREQPVTRYGMPWERQTITFPQADNVEPSRKVIAALMEGDGYPSGENGRKVVESLVAAYASEQKNGQYVKTALENDKIKQTFPWA